MLIERISYSEETSLSESLDGVIFRHCSFSGMAVDGKSVDAVFLSCELINMDWYWGLFNGCLFVDTRFVSCVFKGSNFADCRFVNCEFIDCRFDDDNFRAPCLFDGTQWFGGSAVGCKGLPCHAFSAS